MKQHVLRLLVMSSMFPSSVSAQVRDSTRADSAAIRIGAIRVAAVRPVTTIGGSSAIEVRLDSLSLPAVPTLEHVFREIPMLHVRTNSRGEAEVSVRGSESRQVAVLVDGVPLTAAWDARTDVSVLPAASVQEIGFIRGLSSMLYGPNVLGGIVEIGVGKSFVQPGSRSLQLATGFDHVGGYGASATIGLPGTTRGGGEWLLRAGASFRDSPGQPLADDVVEPVPARDGDLRLNTDARDINGFLSFRYQAQSGPWLALSGSAFTGERGIAAELGLDNARFWRYPHVARTLAVVSGGTGDRGSPLGGNGDVELSLGVDVGRTDIDAYTSRAYDQTNSFEDGRDRTLTVRLLADQTVGTRGELRGAFTYADILHDESVPDGAARYRQRLLSLGGESNWRLIESGAVVNSLRVSVGGAFDIADTPESGGREPQQGRLDEWGARVGLSAAFNRSNTVVHAGASRRGRFPALRELYSGALNRFQPNSGLKPENLVALEAGVTMRILAGELQAVAFRHQLKDAVVRITLPDLRFLRVNRDELESAGIELLGSQTLGPFDVSADLTIQSVELRDSETAQTRRPENLPEVFGRAAARFPLAAGVYARAEADYAGEQFCIDPGTGNDTALAAGAQFNLELSRVWTFGSAAHSWFRRFEGRISADNVSNVARYDQCGLPQPGRLLSVQIRLF